MEPRILIGTPIYEGARVFFDEYKAALGKQGVLFDLLIVDNSPTDNFFQFLQHKRIHVVKVKPKENKYETVLASRKRIVEEFLKKEYTHLFWVDADVILPEKALLKLLSDKKDIVSGVYLSPFVYQGIQIIHPVAYQLTNDDNLRLPLQTPEMEKNTLMQMHSVGFGCCLIKREILEQIPLRRIPRTTSTEDVLFCVDAKKRGYKTFLDTSVLCKHGVNSKNEVKYLEVK